jgi:hypothetical protein
VAVNELIVQREEGGKGGEEAVTAFWKGENRFVSLIPIARNEKVSF